MSRGALPLLSRRRRRRSRHRAAVTGTGLHSPPSQPAELCTTLRAVARQPAGRAVRRGRQLHLGRRSVSRMGDPIHGAGFSWLGSDATPAGAARLHGAGMPQGAAARGRPKEPVVGRALLVPVASPPLPPCRRKHAPSPCRPPSMPPGPVRRRAPLLAPPRLEEPQARRWAGQGACRRPRAASRPCRNAGPLPQTDAMAADEARAPPAPHRLPARARTMGSQAARPPAVEDDAECRGGAVRQRQLSGTPPSVLSRLRLLSTASQPLPGQRGQPARPHAVENDAECRGGAVRQRLGAEPLPLQRVGPTRQTTGFIQILIETNLASELPKPRVTNLKAALEALTAPCRCGPLPLTRTRRAPR
jgi:hypothetical protein